MADIEAGVTRDGFVPESLSNIVTRVQDRLLEISPGFDFSPESPDGQMISIMSSEIALLWDQLLKVYNSYDPYTATGHGLRNIASISGILYGVATRSSATVTLIGTTGVVVPEGSLVSDLEGNQFYTLNEANIPSNVSVVATVAGPIPVPINNITVLDSVVLGWEGVLQNEEGVVGKDPQTEQQFRNLRNRTVMRNTVTIQETMEARLLELGISQVLVGNNDTSAVASDGTPPHSVHVTIGEYGGITDSAIAQVIFDTKGLGLYTHGTTQVVVEDSQGNQHSVRFSKSIEAPVTVVLDVTFLDDEKAGAAEDVKTALVDHINSLAVGEDVIWSRLFPIITPFAKAQINSLLIGLVPGSEAATNVGISDSQFASCAFSSITLTET